MKNLALVTCLYDLVKRGSTQHRTVDWIFENSGFVLGLDRELVIFTEPETEAAFRTRRGDRPTTIVTKPFEELLRLDRAAAALRGAKPRNANAAKDTPVYGQLTWAKFAMLEAALKITSAPYIAWIDLAITHVAKTPPAGIDIFADPSDRVRVHVLRCFDKRDVDHPDYWCNVRGHLAGGLVIGGRDQVQELVGDFWKAADRAISMGLSPLEEGLLSYVVGQRPGDFTYSYGDYEDILRNHDAPRGGEAHRSWIVEDATARGLPVAMGERSGKSEVKARFVSAMFDLSDEVAFRDPIGMIAKTSFLSLDSIDLTLYVSRNLIPHLPRLGANVHVVPMDKEELPLWDRHADVDRARAAFWPTRDPRAPTGSHLVTSSKHYLICRSIVDRPSADPDAWIYWIDFGKEFFRRADVEAIRGFPDADIHLHLCDVVDPHLFADLRIYFERYRFSVCGCLVGARADVWPDLARRLDAVLDRHLAAGVGHGEEQLYNYLLQDADLLKSMRLHLSVGDYRESTANFLAPRENKAHCAYVVRRMVESGRRDLLSLARSYLACDPHLEAIAREPMDMTTTHDDANAAPPTTAAPSTNFRIFRPSFSPGSCYLLRDAAEQAYFAHHGGAPEAQLIDWATQFIAHDETFVDVGAHLGTWAQHFALKCKQVHAFEPQRSTYERLRDGARLAKLGNVVCHDVALGGSGEVDLHIISADGGGSTLRYRKELDTVLGVEQVRCAQLDDFEFDNVGLIKIDAEGFEIDILRGATKTLEKHRPTLLLEAWDHEWYARERAELIAYVVDLGYGVVPVQGWPQMWLVEPMVKRRSSVPASSAAEAVLSPDKTPVSTESSDLMRALQATASLSSDRPLIGLVMIVKNEAKRVAAVLASYRPYINAWTILDTGSTDGTQDLIKRELAGIPGVLHEEPFVDFATSRNRALELHGTATVFSIMPNGDVLQGGAELVSFLEAHRRGLEGAYRVRIAPGHYYHPLVMRTGFGWRYKWRTHECAMGPNTGAAIPGVTVLRDRGARTSDEWRTRWTRDLDLLNRDRTDDPNDPRPYFYLGQTHECLDQPAEALEMYEKRATMGGYFDEVFEAKFRIGKMMEKLRRPWSEIQHAYLEAYAHDPRRAEPLYAVSQHWYDKGVHAVSRLFATVAAEMSKPPTDLFLDEDVYTWKAADRAAISSFYSGHKQDGRDFAEQAVSFRPNDERLRTNRAFYSQSAIELFGAEVRAIDFSPEPDWNASNPSIYFDGDRLRCVVRTVNYKIVNGSYVTPPEDVVRDEGSWKGWQIIRTRNFLLDLDADFKTTRVVEIVDKTGDARTSYPIHGFEDARLFAWKGTWWATATVCNFTEDGRREIALLQIDDDGAVVRAEPLRGPWSVHAQKNWMPFVDTENDRVKFIYATSLNGDVGSTTIFDLVEADDPEARPRYSIQPPPGSTFDHGRLRGGSQAVRVDGGWLFAVHDVTFPGDSGRMYLHRFVLIDDKLELVSMTDPFYFERLGIEFCAGLARVGDKIVASYAVNDGSARLGIFDWQRVRRALRKDFVI